MLKTAAATAFAATLLALVYVPTGPPPRGADRLVRFRNEARQPIVELHVSTVGSEDWRGDLLGLDYLPPGNSVLVVVDDRSGSCRVDVKILLDDGSERVSRVVDVCRAAGRAVALH
jgi:hypothetical protein